MGPEPQLGHALRDPLGAEERSDAALAVPPPDEDGVAGGDLIPVARDGPGDLGVRVGQAIVEAIELRVVFEDPIGHRRHPVFARLSGVTRAVRPRRSV